MARYGYAMTRTLRWIPVLATILVAFAFTACGDDDDDDPNATEPAGTATAAATEAVDETPSGGDGEPTEPAETATATEEPGVPFEGSTDRAEQQPDPEALPALVTDARMGENEGFDRFVLEFESEALPGYRIEYVNQAAFCGSGKLVSLPGTAILTVTVTPASAHSEEGEALTEQEIPGPGDLMLEAIQTCDFEGIVAWAISVDGRLPFRVLTLEDPLRIAIDVRQ